MGKTNKLSKLSDADHEAFKKLSKKQKREVIADKTVVNGIPDQTDVDGLRILFETYDKATAGQLYRMMKQNEVERKLKSVPDEPVATAKTLSFFMPQDLQEVVEEYWPTIWSNKEHLRWFLTYFPGFRR